MQLREDTICDLRKTIESVSTGAKSAEEILAHLDKIGLECYVTEKRDLAVKCWQIIEGFVSEEYAGIIRSSQSSPMEGDEMDWLSKNLQTIQKKYAGQWIGIGDNEIVGSAPSLQELLILIIDKDKPLITFIPAEPTVWTFTYGFQGF
ncbi:MAG: hypothetical protein FJ134_16545 [Deltaproteobacteria bacterium]|nr:hypothetical protein [Deltaproteobacteria bacterium]